MTFIDVQSLNRKFRKVTAIDDISFQIEQGELFGIIGPDGAGKTTLLRMMATIMNPTRGTITINNHDSVKDAEAIKQIMGYLPQSFGLYADLSVQENMQFMADVYEVSRDVMQERFQALYDFTNLHDFKGYKAGQLSGGMKKKLGLACALIHQPQLLLLDEPTNGVDPVARRVFWDLLSGLHAKGTTAVISTPYMDEAERCNRVLLLYQGHILACDTPQAIKAQIPGEMVIIDTSDNQLAQKHLNSLDGLIEIQTYGEQLHLIVHDSDQAQADIATQLQAQNIALHRMVSAPIRMEEAFIYLISHAEEVAL